MAEEAPEITVEKETKKEEGGEDIKQFEGDDDKKEETPVEEEIGIIYNAGIQKIKFLNKPTIADIDLTDPDVETAAVKKQAAFGKKKAKK